VFGALGVFLGSAVVAGHGDRLPRSLFLALWTLVALALAAGAVISVLHHPGWGWRVLFAVTALLPLAASVPFWIRRS